MTPHQMMLIRTTFARVVPIADTAAGRFYAKLFEFAPSLRQCSAPTSKSRAAS